MPVDQEEILRLSTLALLSVDLETSRRLAGDLREILEVVEHLDDDDQPPRHTAPCPLRPDRSTSADSCALVDAIPVTVEGYITFERK